MSTAAIFNGYGHYESTPDGQKGITLSHGGVKFWLPYDEVTYIPDFTMREVDHNKSTADKEEESTLTYMTFLLSGARIAEELLAVQIPVPNRDMGIILISNSPEKRLNEYVTVHAGYTEEGVPLSVEVQKIRPSEMEIAEAHRLARAYKESVIQEYFQSKRERMAGGPGRVFPNGIVKVFMDELGVKDIDDVTRQMEAVATTPGMTPEMFLVAMKEMMRTLQPVAAPVAASATPVDQNPTPVQDKTAAKNGKQSIV